MNKSRLWSKNYIFLLLAVVFAAFTHNAFTVVFPVYILKIGGTNALTGFMMTGLTVAGIITRVIFGPLIDSIGRKKILVLGSVSFALNTIAYCFVTSIPGLFALRILNGVSQGIFFPVPPTLAADIAPEDRLIDAIGYFGIASSISAAIAPVAGLWIFENLGVLPLFILTSVFAAVSVIFTLLIKDKYRVPQKGIEEKNHKEPIKKSVMGKFLELSVIVPALISFFVFFGNSSVTNFLSTCGIERNIGNISLFFFVNNMVVIVTRLYTGRLARKVGKMKLIALGIFLVALSTLLISFSYSIETIVAISVMFVTGISMLTQLLNVSVIEMVPISRRGVANSTFMLFGDIGLGLGATVWGVSSTYGGYTLTYILSAVVILAALAIHLICFIPKYKAKIK